jgi:hypothetical protein
MPMKEIENALGHLPTAKPPEDLKARCLATIPEAAGDSPRRTWRERIKMQPILAAAAVTAGLVLTGILGMPRQPALSGAVVFAATVEAMKKVPFYHAKGRLVGLYPDGEGRDGDGWYSRQWINDEDWFDAEQGRLLQSSPSQSNAETFMPWQQMLDLPDGSCHYRVGDRLKITEFSPQRWERNKAFLVSRFADLVQQARGFNYEADPKLVSTEPGDWKGRSVIVITFEAPPPKEKAARGAPTVRTLFYVDSAAKLCIATQQFARSANGNEMLVGESDLDYSQRPDKSLFDPRRLEQGVVKITRAKGKPGSFLEPGPE